jgi:hypothetical protein
MGEIKSSWDKALPQPAQEKLVVDDLNAIHKAFKDHGYLSKEETAATQKFLDDLKPLSVTERIAAAHRANILELHDALDEGREPYVYFPTLPNGVLLPQYAHGVETNNTHARNVHMKSDNMNALDQDLAKEKAEAEAKARQEEARKKVMGK